MSTWPLDPQFTDGEDLTEVEMNDRVTDKLNELRALIPDPQFVAVGRNISPQGIPDSSVEAVTFYDAGVQYSAGSLITRPGSGVLETSVSGVWRWSATVIWDAIGAGAADHHRDVLILLNGTEPTFRAGRTNNNYAAGARLGVTQSAGGTVATDAADQLTLCLYQTSGLTLNVNSVLFALERIA